MPIGSVIFEVIKNKKALGYLELFLKLYFENYASSIV
ncbi:hypothetical protein CLU83_1764 [Flavobacterium sp. 1]|nr:hypothetical protein CLU83_1764 [Flavobacterium sp. 1]